MLKKFIKDIAKYSLSKLLPALTAFITTPILTSLFPPEEYGTWALALSVSSFMIALTVSGFGGAVIRFYPAYKAKSTLNTFFSTIFITTSAITIFIAGAGLFFSVSFREFLPSALIEFLPLIIVIFIAQSVFVIYMAVLRAREKSGVFTTFQLLLNYGGLGLGLVLVIFFDFRVDGLLLGTLLTLLLIVPILFYVATKGTKVKARYFKMQDAFHIMDYALPLTIGNVAMWGLRLSDLFIINFFYTEKDVGLYSVSYNISAKSIELLVALFLLSVSPLLMNTWEREGQEATEKSLKMVTRVYLIVCLPAVVGLSVLAFPFVALLTSPEYYEGYKIFGLVALSSFAWGLANIAQMGMAIKKRTRRLGANQIMAALVHITLAIFLVPRFGYAAAAISTLIGYSVLLILQARSSQRYISWRFPFSTLRNVLVASLLMGLVAYGIYGLAGDGNDVSILYLLLSILISIAVYSLLLWVLGEVRESEKGMVLQLWNKVSNGKEKKM